MPTLETSIDDDIARATGLLAEKRWTEAQSLCHGILNRAPEHPVAYHLLGVIAFQIDRPEIAVGLFRRSVELAPHPEVLRNLGLALDRVERHSEAVEVYERALAIDPAAAETCNALGFARAQLGDAPGAIGGFERALALKPGFPVAIENLCAFRRLAGWVEPYNAGLNDTLLDPGDVYPLLVGRAVGEYAQGRHDETRRTLDEASVLRPGPAVQGSANSARALESLLSVLVANRGWFPDRQVDRRIHTIGDSHILPYAVTILDLGNVEHSISADWLLMSLAGDLARAATSRSAAALAHNVESLPQRAVLLCSFGGTDCQLHGPLMERLRKRRGDIESVVAVEARRYVDAVSRIARPRALQIFFLGVPAAHPGIAATPEERQLHATILHTYNREQRQAVVDLGHAFIDLHELTVRPGGVGRVDLYADLLHLRPEALRRAPIYLLGTRF